MLEGAMPLTCYNQALKLLALRPHFRAELAAKLARRAYAAEEVEAALDLLAERRLLDDTAAAAGFVAGRAGRGEGRTRIAAELRQRGADGEAVAQALAALPEDEGPAAREAAARWRARGGADPAALARHLARKGFSRRAIYGTLKDTGDDGALPEDGES
jgi:regulatory protein